MGMKEKAATEYARRILKVLEFKLNGGNVNKRVNT